jgi:uncharacterized protein (TIGR02996 family)
MTSDELAFRRAVIDNPADDLPRLVFADWLDERGDPRGEFIRVQVELARGPAPARFADLEDRERELIYRHRSTWLGHLDRDWRGDAVFERGFVAEVTVGAIEFIRMADRWLRYEPIRKTTLYGAVVCMRDLAACPAIARLSVLCLRKNELRRGHVAQLLRSPYLSGLDELDLSFNDLGPSARALVVNSPKLARLKEIRLEENSDDDPIDDPVPYFRRLIHPWRFGGSRRPTRRPPATPPP